MDKECQHKTLDPKFPTCQHCLDCPWAKCHEDTELTKENWIESFDKKFPDLSTRTILYKNFKFFISELLSKQKEEIRRKIETDTDVAWQLSRQKTKEEITEKIKEMKKMGGEFGFCEHCKLHKGDYEHDFGTCSAYDKALDDVLETLKAEL